MNTRHQQEMTRSESSDTTGGKRQRRTGSGMPPPQRKNKRAQVDQTNVEGIDGPSLQVEGGIESSSPAGSGSPASSQSHSSSNNSSITTIEGSSCSHSISSGTSEGTSKRGRPNSPNDGSGVDTRLQEVATGQCSGSDSSVAGNQSDVESGVAQVGRANDQVCFPVVPCLTRILHAYMTDSSAEGNSDECDSPKMFFTQ